MNEQPQPKLTDPAFQWTRPEHTDVQATWRKFGWTPPSESKKDERKAA
jgi:hypothetical protein